MSLAKLIPLFSNDPVWKAKFRQIISKCLQAGKVHKILVFGSYANKKMTGDSDLDIAVVLSNEESVAEYRKKLIQPLCDWPLDLVIVNEKRYEERKDFGGVLFDAEHEGIELYPNWGIN